MRRLVIVGRGKEGNSRCLIFGAFPMMKTIEILIQDYLPLVEI
jgi:hypothetical protein